jgi:hypothetical protein
MTMNDDSKTTNEVNHEVSSAYQGLAIECAPDNLDRSVLRSARKEVQSENGRYWRAAWYRPAAFVATVSLSLALLLQLGDVALFSPPVDDGDPALNGVTPVSENAFQEAAEVSARQLRQIEAEANASMSSSAPDMSDPTPAVAGARNDAGTLLQANEYCSDRQKTSSSSWWRCIQELEKSGQSQAAERELQALFRAFPRFIAPQ